MRNFFTLMLSICIALNLTAQTNNPATWTYSAKKINAQEYDLIFKANLEKGWHIYSQFTEDGGPLPTTFTIEDNATLIGKAKEESAHRNEYKEPLFDNVNVIDFSKEVTFIQRVKVKDINKPIKGYLEYQACIDGMCLPPKPVDFSFDVSKIDNTSTLVAATETPTVKTSDKNKSTTSLPVVTIPTATIAKEEASSQITSNTTKTLPVHWNYTVKKINETEYDLIFKSTIDEGWHIYSQMTEDGGPIPLSFNFEDESNVSAVGKAKEESLYKKEHKEPLFDNIKVIDFEKEATFTQRIKVKDASKPIKGYLEYQACTNQMCLPPEPIDFSFDLIKGVGNEAGKENNSPSTTPNDRNIFGLPIDMANATTECGTEAAPTEESGSLWLIFLLGFGGGLLAILTPCVFPMIPLTVGFFTKSSKDRKSGIRNALWYGASIIIIYVTIGLLITSIFGADALNQLSTNAFFNIAFCILFLIFAVSFFGYFEITLPESWVNKSDKAADKGGLIGIFFMAFTLSLVSFSCTGPIIGTLLVETATGSSGSSPTLFGHIPLGPLMGMFGFALALALPFGLFAAFPAWLNTLPKSGGWLNDVKVTLGFIEVALAFKFLSVADLTMGWKIMPYEAFVAIWVLCALGLALYYFGILKFSHYGKIKRTTPRTILGVLSILMCIYFAWGFNYNPVSETFKTPNLLSGIAPPAGHSYIYPKECPLNLNCFHDFEEGLAFAKQEGKPILIDFTGYGCVNCRRMEDNVWSKEGVYELIRDKYVLISLYVDDRKKLDKEYTSPIDGSTRRTVGNKWTDFEIKFFNRDSQPYYVLMSDDLKVLNNPKAYTPDEKEYQAFLQCGIDNYAKLKK